jgi:hypothetical protein
MTASGETEPIAPGAALQDSALCAALDTRARRSGCLFARQDRIDVPVIRHLLATCPWQTADYRYGRWMHALRDFGYGISWYRWTRTYDTFQLLAPAGRPLAELAPRSKRRLQPPAGRLRFAGNPAVAIAYLPEGAGPEQVAFATAAHLKPADALALALQPHPAAHAGPAPQLSVIDERRPWLAHQPAKPPRPQR